MPKQAILRSSRRAVPYNIPTSTNTNMASQIASYQSNILPGNWSSAQFHGANMMPIMDMINTMPPTQHQHQRHASNHSIQPTQSGPWTSQEDEILVQARNSGQGWGQIHEKHFPTKTANACRKRFERLMIKRRGTDWDEARMEKLAAGYREMRESMWKPLADKLGERWDHVEKACMSQGLKNLSSMANNHTRNQSHASSHFSGASESEHFSSNDEREDSGIAFGGDINRRRPSESGSKIQWHQILQQPVHEVHY